MRQGNARIIVIHPFVIWIDYTTGKWRNDGPLYYGFLYST